MLTNVTILRRANSAPRALKHTVGGACSAGDSPRRPPEFFNVGGERVRTTRGNRNRREQDSRLPLPGTLLSREWKGRTILVEVLAKGFRYESRPFSSLSAIAVAITGTRWNGLAFFGLTHPAGGQQKEQPGA